jgi:hypothetical protein
MHWKPNPGDEVFSIGCNHGERPTVAPGRITAVNKYQGGENYTASPRPIDGRSGGGLFTVNGQFLGVCNAADPQEDEGLYAAIPRLAKLLDQHQLSFVYESDTPPHTPVASRAAANDTAANASARSAGPQSIADRGSSSPWVPNTTARGGAGRTARELVCVVRGDDGESQILVIGEPDPELLKTLRLAAKPR